VGFIAVRYRGIEASERREADQRFEPAPIVRVAVIPRRAPAVKAAVLRGFRMLLALAPIEPARVSRVGIQRDRIPNEPVVLELECIVICYGYDDLSTHFL